MDAYLSSDSEDVDAAPCDAFLSSNSDEDVDVAPEDAVSSYDSEDVDAAQMLFNYRTLMMILTWHLGMLSHPMTRMILTQDWQMHSILRVSLRV